MKKQIFSLVLSAAILTTSPLFGMKRILADEGKTSSTLRKLKTEEDQGLPISSVLLPKDVIQYIVSKLPIKAMFRFSLTSKPMYALCEDPIHSYLEKNECIVDNPKLSLDFAINEYFSLFKDKTKTYTVTIPQLRAFLKGEIYQDERLHAYKKAYGPNTGNPAIDWTVYKKPKSLSFSIGERKFQIFNRNFCEDKLDTLRLDAYVTFVWKSYPRDPNQIWEWNSYPESPDHFYAEFVSCSSNTVVRDLSNPKYLKQAPDDIARAEYIRNYFQIEEIKSEKI
jgi:hypothetical protein